MPRDTIERAIQKGTGELAGEEIHEVLYEAYGPGGAGILIQAITDNLNRTVPEVRGVLEKRGGTLGKPGSVAWNFEKKALFTVKTSAVPEDRLLEVALEAGADDVRNEGESYAIVAPSDAFPGIEERLRKEGIAAETSDVTFVAKSPVPLAPEDARRMVQLVEALEELEDVQSAITNADIPDDVLAELALG
jgi:YebC/PmpR family DNA-binding regulatory protein